MKFRGVILLLGSMLFGGGSAICPKLRAGQSAFRAFGGPGATEQAQAASARPPAQAQLHPTRKSGSTAGDYSEQPPRWPSNSASHHPIFNGSSRRRSWHHDHQDGE